MASRLLHSLVGVGIALGASGTGCLGETGSSEAEGATNDDTSAASAESTAQSAGSVSTSTSGMAASGTASATTGDGSNTPTGSSSTSGSGSGTAAGGAPTDTASTDGAAGTGGAMEDAFCDVAWPTTKGQPNPPECADPDHECVDELVPQPCALRVGESACELGESQATSTPICLAGTWHCRAGRVPIDECACWEPAPEGMVCSPSGLVPIEPGE